MSKIYKDLKLKIEDDLATHLAWLEPNLGEFRVLKQSVDARARHAPHFIYSVEVTKQGEKLSEKAFSLEKISESKQKSVGPNSPIIVGTGPAGLFAALRLVERGIPCRIFERGSKSEERIKGINRFWRYGELDTKNNVCYGEGGAGLYSDGKLITRIKSEHIPYVMNRLVQFGAPAEIEWLSNPHVGSDKIRRVIPKLRSYLLENGCELHFDSQVTGLLYQDSLGSSGSKRIHGIRTIQGQSFFADHVILATGHSAEDMLNHLMENDVFVEGKSFAMGLRIEHPQKSINKIQYRDYAEHPKLGSANYKLAHHDHKTGLGVYSFCMCPGGYVLSSGTESGGIVCNGMSNFNRNSPFANAAIVVTIDHQKLFGADRMGGMKLRKQLETDAFLAVQKSGGTKELPVQSIKHFLDSKLDSESMTTSSPSGIRAVRLDQIVPKFMKEKLIEGLEAFDRNMKGFISADAKFYGIESRTSCPLRVTRDPATLQSVSHAGLFPCGEGAGYAGGITSAACDGIDCADQIFAEIK